MINRVSFYQREKDESWYLNTSPTTMQNTSPGKWNLVWRMSGEQHIIQIYLCEITDMVVLRHISASGVLMQFVVNTVFVVSLRQ